MSKEFTSRQEFRKQTEVRANLTRLFEPLNLNDSFIARLPASTKAINSLMFLHAAGRI